MLRVRRFFASSSAAAALTAVMLKRIIKVETKKRVRVLLIIFILYNQKDLVSRSEELVIVGCDRNASGK
jgi:hypothetical protein